MNSAHPANITSSVANNSDTSCVDNNHQPEGNKEEEQEEGYVRTAAQNYGKKINCKMQNRSSQTTLFRCRN
jgi:hypothetical protein